MAKLASKYMTSRAWGRWGKGETITIVDQNTSCGQIRELNGRCIHRQKAGSLLRAGILVEIPKAPKKPRRTAQQILEDTVRQEVSQRVETEVAVKDQVSDRVDQAISG